jgi:hypothetical protein
MIAGRRLRETEMTAFDHPLRAKHDVNLATPGCGRDDDSPPTGIRQMPHTQQ